jgi:hypothetical protein
MTDHAPGSDTSHGLLLAVGELAATFAPKRPGPSAQLARAVDPVLDRRSCATGASRPGMVDEGSLHVPELVPFLVEFRDVRLGATSSPDWAWICLTLLG